MLQHWSGRSPAVQPWWYESCAQRARWSWQTSFLGRTRPACSRGPRWQAPWRRGPSSHPRYHWLVGWVASVPLERLMTDTTGQLVWSSFRLWVTPQVQSVTHSTHMFLSVLFNVKRFRTMELIILGARVTFSHTKHHFQPVFVVFFALLFFFLAKKRAMTNRLNMH